MTTIIKYNDGVLFQKRVILASTFLPKPELQEPARPSPPVMMVNLEKEIASDTNTVVPFLVLPFRTPMAVIAKAARF